MVNSGLAQWELVACSIHSCDSNRLGVLAIDSLVGSLASFRTPMELLTLLPFWLMSVVDGNGQLPKVLLWRESDGGGDARQNVVAGAMSVGRSLKG